MLNKFWESVGGKLADRFANVSVPALIFWLGGLLAWAYSHGGLARLHRLGGRLGGQSSAVQVTMLLVVLIAVGCSGVVIGRLSQSALGILEGYWPAWLDWYRSRRIDSIRRRVAALDDRWQELARDVMPDIDADPAKTREFQRVERSRRKAPSNARKLMPTRIGNILRGAETRPIDKYGLDLIAIWPCLWLVLPDLVRQELTTARAALDASVATLIWGMLFVVFTPWTLIALPIGLVVALSALVWRIPANAETFGGLLEASVDLHRADLYRQLRWPLPSDPEHEVAEGRRLTAYLWRGSHDRAPSFVPPA
jgi:hypothetical protein